MEGKTLDNLESFSCVLSVICCSHLLELGFLVYLSVGEELDDELPAALC